MSTRLQPGPAENRQACPLSRQDLERDAYIDVASTVDRLQRHFGACLKPFNLTVAQFNVLRAVALAEGPVSVGYITEAMLTQTPDMTRLLDRLEVRELISRSSDAQDRRSVTITLSSSGRKLQASAGRAVDDEHRRQWSGLSDRDLLHLQDLVLRVRNAVDGPASTTKTKTKTPIQTRSRRIS